MTKNGKKIDAPVFLSLSGGGLAETLHVSNAQEIVRRDGHPFSPIPFLAYIQMRLSAFSCFRIMDNQDLIDRFNKSVITATIELARDGRVYVIRTKGTRFKHHIDLRVSGVKPQADLYPLYQSLMFGQALLPPFCVAETWVKKRNQSM